MLSRALSTARRVLRTGGHPATEFAPDTLPWLDRAFVTIDEYVSSLNGDAAVGLRERLLHWMQFGYVVLPDAVEHSLIDAYLADIDEAFQGRELSVNVQTEEGGIRPLRQCTVEELATKHLRIMDFHNPSVAGKRLALHPRIIDFIRHVFREPPVAMQTLTFIYGSEQSTHQDFPYVVAPGCPSHLAASWIALEDVHPDAGPLGYYPGSHTLPKFQWGNGLFFTKQSTRDPAEFAAYLDREAERMGLGRATFCPRKGDVFFWHSSLAHMGTKVNEPDRTRRSLVTHYSSRRGCPVDRRAINEKPVVFEYNGGFVYRDPVRPGEEDSLTRGSSL